MSQLSGSISGHGGDAGGRQIEPAVSRRRQIWWVVLTIGGLILFIGGILFVLYLTGQVDAGTFQGDFGSEIYGSSPEKEESLQALPFEAIFQKIRLGLGLLLS